jgi:nucleosome assembly protein 1-like 1
LVWQYLDLNKPLYERRLAIISGTAKPTPEEIQAGEEQSLKDDPTYEKLPADSSDTAPIPEFWLTALRNHVGTSDIITDRDAAALKHLIDVHVTYTTPKPGFKLTFIFTSNEYFENEALEKTYYYQEEVGYSGDFLYDRAIGTTIRWKEEKDLTKEFEIKKQRNKSASDISLSSSFAHSPDYRWQTRIGPGWFARHVPPNHSSTSSLLLSLPHKMP